MVSKAATAATDRPAHQRQPVPSPRLSRGSIPTADQVRESSAVAAAPEPSGMSGLDSVSCFGLITDARDSREDAYRQSGTTCVSWKSSESAQQGHRGMIGCGRWNNTQQGEESDLPTHTSSTDVEWRLRQRILLSSESHHRLATYAQWRWAPSSPAGRPDMPGWPGHLGLALHGSREPFHGPSPVGDPPLTHVVRY